MMPSMAAWGMTLFSEAKVAILCSEVAVMMPYLATAVLTF
jgi:hypothetical protein